MPTAEPSLPAHRTSFIGRKSELAALRELLASPAPRLLTLVGPGGAGKTRLALQVLAEPAHANPPAPAPWWIELAGLADPALVPQIVAEALVQNQETFLGATRCGS